MKSNSLRNTHSIKTKVSAILCSTIIGIVSILSTPTVVGQETELAEEIVITGSFIRRSEGFTQASQVTQLSAEDLEAEGTLNIGEVMQNLAFVNGSASAITNTIQGTDSRSSSVDLRGLGARSTLTLLDGKRLVNENVNALIPTIAIQRLDIVADGAAALYGNEAVAGVVNFVPYKSYEGLKVETYAEQTDNGDFDEHSVQVLWGGDVGEIDVVLAGQFRANSRLGWDERPILSQSGLFFSSNAPGNWVVPQRDETGVYSGSNSNLPDPACAPASERDFFQVNQNNNPYGMLTGSTCRFDFGDNRSFRDPMETSQFFANATWEANDDLTLSLQGFRTRLYEQAFGSLNSSGGQNRIPELPVVRGEIPGNPFRAIDANGNALFGIDADGNGVPDRQAGLDLNGDGLDDYLVSGSVNNGIPLYEDVVPRRHRPINKTMGAIAGQHINGLSEDMDRLDHSTDRIHRWTLQADFTVPFVEGWEGSASYTRNYRERELLILDSQDISAMIQGLNCDVVNDRESCYNPFFVTDPAKATQAHVVEAILNIDPSAVEDELDVIDLVFTGDLPLGGFELPGGVIGAAVGYQYREEAFKNTPASAAQAGNAYIGQGDLEPIVTGGREIDAFFAELAIPVLDDLELELAVRREEFNSGQESTDPKYGVTWGPTEWLTLRATHGEAFIAPTPEQLFNPEQCGLGSVDDPFGPFNAFGTVCTGGNPNLRNEQSESAQLGFDLVFGDFDLHVTWNNTDFDNRIVSTLAQQIVDLDFFNFQQATGFTGPGEPTPEQVQAWINNPASDPRIERSADNVQDISLVRSGASNAESVEVTAWDILANYSFSLNNIGDFRVRLQATYIDEWLFQEDPTQPVIDGAGRLNDGTGTAPGLPQIKANLLLGWTRNNHNITGIVRYVDDLIYDGPRFTGLVGRVANTFPDPSIFDTGVLAWTDMDIAYTYRGLELFDGELAFSLGSRNVFDREAQRSPDFAGVIGELQDPTGRIIYGRLVYDF
jgi:iron complex outermembrane receptor protein